MTRAKTVLVPLDGSLHATTAVPVARELGELYHATVVVFHVTDDALASAALVDRMSLSSEDVRGLVVERSPGAAAVAIVREAAEREAALIVMCPRTRTDRGARILGTVAEAVLRAAPCPVVLVPPTRGRGHWALRRLLLPHDGTPTSAAVIGPATQLASTAAAELVVLHVATPGTERPQSLGRCCHRAMSTSPSTSGQRGRESFSIGYAPLDAQRRVSTCASHSLKAKLVQLSSTSRGRTIATSSFWAGAVRLKRTAREQCGASSARAYAR